MATLNTNTTADGSATPTPAMPSALNPSRPPAASYQPTVYAMRASLEQASQINSHKGKQIRDVLFNFDQVHGQLEELMSEKGFFPGFTQEQKLWYIDATLYDRFCEPIPGSLSLKTDGVAGKKMFGRESYKIPCPPDQPQLSTGPEHEASTSVQISPGQINNRVAIPLSQATENPNLATLPGDNVCNEVGVDLVDESGLPTSAPLRASPQTSHGQNQDDYGQEVSLKGNMRSSEPQKLASTSQYRANKGSGLTHTHSFPGNQPPLDLHLDSSSLLRKRRTSHLARATQRGVGGIKLPSKSRVTKPQAKVQQVPTPGGSADIKQEQSSPSMNQQQLPTRPASTMLDQPQINLNWCGGSTITQYPQESLQMMAPSGPLNMNFPPHPTTRPQQMQSYGDPRNNPIAQHGSPTEHGRNYLSGSPRAGQNQIMYPQNNEKQSPEVASMSARSYSQNHKQQRTHLSNFNDQPGYQPPQGNGLSNDSTYLAAIQYQQQNGHQRSHSDWTIPVSPQVQSPQSKYLMGLPVDNLPQGSPNQFVQPNFRHSHTLFAPTQNSSSYGHGHAHFASHFANHPGQAQPQPNGFASPGPMHFQPIPAQMLRTNSAPPVYAQPDHQKYWSNGRGQPAPNLQGGYPMVRGNGVATHNPNMPRQYLLPEDQARLDSGFNRKRNLDELSEGDSLAHGPAKR
ncbi:hypothetical protein IFR05_010456 [Cadophora sp. M221]|nr:hypothetical protein IFR05_010456 [Cadophora sp. M221]